MMDAIADVVTDVAELSCRAGASAFTRKDGSAGWPPP